MTKDRFQGHIFTYAFVLASIASGANAQTAGTSSGGAQTNANTASSAFDDAGDTMQQVRGATDVVKKMESDTQLKALMQQAKGIFIVPKYGRAGLGVAGRGGEGVLLVNNTGKWSNPVFYDLGGASIGAQAGVEVGSMAMLLMNDKAVKNFMQENKFSLTADAGLTIADYSAKARGDLGRGDIVVWSDTKGAFASAAVGITDISFDDDDNRDFYKTQVSAKDIVDGKVKSAQASSLTQELSSGK